MQPDLTVLAIGGNSLIKDKTKIAMWYQYEALKETVAYIADLIEDGMNMVITHGNGPGKAILIVFAGTSLTETQKTRARHTKSETTLNFTRPLFIVSLLVSLRNVHKYVLLPASPNHLQSTSDNSVHRLLTQNVPPHSQLHPTVKRVHCSEWEFKTESE
jgi:hypothetical protein